MPLGLEEAAALLAPLRDAERVVLAVSGGPDSVALMNLAARVRGALALPPLAVATVDHGLHRRSRRVAQTVADASHRLGLEARILTWAGPKPPSGVQEAARAARYGLLAGFAAEIGATHLVTAHTLDDQAETILFRLARGSGPAGLVGMLAETRRMNIVHCRPFLAIEKTRLVASCRSEGWSFVDDAANHDPRYARTRLRALLPLLAAEGLDARRFATLAGRLALMEAALDAAAEGLRVRALRSSATDRRVYDAAVILAQPRAIQVRLLERVLADFCRPGPPRLGRLEGLVADLDGSLRRALPLRRTLHGALIRLRTDGTLELRPERPRRRGATAPPAHGAAR